MRIAQVKFYDHAWGNAMGLTICTVIGEICEEFSDNICLIIRVWKTEEEGEVYDPVDGNQEYASIIRDAIIEMSIFEEVAEKEEYLTGGAEA